MNEYLVIKTNSTKTIDHIKSLFVSSGYFNIEGLQFRVVSTSGRIDLSYEFGLIQIPMEVNKDEK